MFVNISIYKIFPFLLFAFSFPLTSDSLLIQSESIIDLRNLNYNEKMDTLRFVKNQSNKIILFLPQYRLKVQNIISLDKDSLEVELLNSWWWNKPKSRHSVYYNISPIESTSNHSKPSFTKILPIQEIVAIEILDKNSLIILFLPALIVLMVMGIFGL